MKRTLAAFLALITAFCASGRANAQMFLVPPVPFETMDEPALVTYEVAVAPDVSPVTDLFDQTVLDTNLQAISGCDFGAAAGMWGVSALGIGFKPNGPQQLQTTVMRIRERRGQSISLTSLRDDVNLNCRTQRLPDGLFDVVYPQFFSVTPNLAFDFTPQRQAKVAMADDNTFVLPSADSVSRKLIALIPHGVTLPEDFSSIAARPFNPETDTLACAAEDAGVVCAFQTADADVKPVLLPGAVLARAPDQRLRLAALGR